MRYQLSQPLQCLTGPSMRSEPRHSTPSQSNRNQSLYRSKSLVAMARVRSTRSRGPEPALIDDGLATYSQAKIGLTSDSTWWFDVPVQSIPVSFLSVP